ncbi:MAG: sigma-70 family RNA polymerase sigma factor [Polyangiaceae bacterium]|nr:sigma-70 family RNA polymerase sigma factor [Polyangiaceae bacterium]
MTPEQTSHPCAHPAFEDLYQAYGAELRKWLYRMRLSAQDAEDAAQEVWLVVAAHPERIPTSATEAQRELRRIAWTIARTMERRVLRNADRRDRTQPDELQGGISHVEQLDNLSELMDAIDQLDETNRELFIAYKILEYSLPEIAAMTGLGEDAIWLRVWNACAKIRKTLARNQKRDERRGVIIAPAEIEIAPETRAAMCALWSLEGRMPNFGGPKDPPPPPPPIPWFANASPVVKEAARGVTLKVSRAILLVLLLLTSAGIVALYFFWNPAQRDTARTGLRVPPLPDVSEINDVVEYEENTSNPASSARTSTRKAPTPKASTSTESLNEDALRALKLDGSGLTRSGSGSE